MKSPNLEGRQRVPPVAGRTFALTRAIEGFLFHVSPTDPATYTAIALLLVIVALAAGLIPATWATRIDPMRALRMG